MKLLPVIVFLDLCCGIHPPVYLYNCRTDEGQTRNVCELQNIDSFLLFCFFNLLKYCPFFLSIDQSLYLISPSVQRRRESFLFWRAVISRGFGTRGRKSEKEGSIDLVLLYFPQKGINISLTKYKIN